MPPGWTLLGALSADEEDHGLSVEIETAEEKDWVVEEVLEFDHEFGEGVELHDSVVVGAEHVVEEAVGDGEKGHVLDVGVVFGGICDNVMDIVGSFPPTGRETTAEIGDEDG